MAETTAETAYVFRHALLREAAYQLQPPAQRARLHELALEAIPALFAPLGESAVDQQAADLADHAMLAAIARRDSTGNLARLRELAVVEAHWLQRAAQHATAAYELSRALDCWNRVAALPDTTPALRALALVEGLRLRRGLGRVMEVTQLAPSVVQAAQQTGDARLQARALQIAALATLDTASPAQAETIGRKALEQAVAGGDELLIAGVGGNLAVYMATQRRFEEARAQYQAVLEVFRRRRDWSEYATSLGNLANIDSQLGHYARSERAYRVALALARRHGNPRDLAHLYDKLGIVCAYQARDHDARKWMEQAVSWARRSGDRSSYGATLGNLATVLGDVGEPERGREMLWQALEVNRECGNSSGLATCAINLSERMAVDDPRAGPLLDEAEAAALRISAGNYVGVIRCMRALRNADTVGLDATRAAWLQGLALIRAARASWEEESVLAAMRGFCARRGVAEFAPGPQPG